MPILNFYSNTYIPRVTHKLLILVFPLFRKFILTNISHPHTHTQGPSHHTTPTHRALSFAWLSLSASVSADPHPQAHPTRTHPCGPHAPSWHLYTTNPHHTRTTPPSPHEDRQGLVGWARKSQAAETGPGLPLCGPERASCPSHPGLLTLPSPTASLVPSIPLFLPSPPWPLSRSTCLMVLNFSG